ncbi:replication terminus site-binding protein [Pseudomonas nitroreducens]|uniref:Replication terminus site-binding protein n=1 Tax=Pseudomonas nitroreducens TaxID=46680 RepID=A0ABS0KIC4_PSENT|nr:DNA replication terminus site-binding protein [Pseudomonas nitroreducens]MBG6287826.1 replication terminus site-binding protein [Pseudomonas nitroreducens]
MTRSIVDAYTELLRAMATFNERWPSLVEEGAVWELPLLQEQRTPKQIPVRHLSGEEALSAALAAFKEFERDLGQAPGTVMRLPGYFILSSSILAEGRAVNRRKAELESAIEAERKFRNVSVSRRSQIMRQALGKNFSLNQLKRTIQVFDAAPRQITFTWAGHTSGKEKIRVAQVRELLLAEAKERGATYGIQLEQTPQWLDLRGLSNMAEDDFLDVPKLVAPHPRCMLWFSDSSRYDAMLHANLPFFVLRGDRTPKVVGLKDFDSSARTAKRPDSKSREPALPGGRFFVADDASTVTGTPAAGTIEGVETTYAESLNPQRHG